MGKELTAVEVEGKLSGRTLRLRAMRGGRWFAAVVGANGAEFAATGTFLEVLGKVDAFAGGRLT